MNVEMLDDQQDDVNTWQDHLDKEPAPRSGCTQQHITTDFSVYDSIFVAAATTQRQNKGLRTMRLPYARPTSCAARGAALHLEANQHICALWAYHAYHSGFFQTYNDHLICKKAFF